MMYDYDSVVNYKGKLEGKTSFNFFSSTYCSSFPALVLDSGFLALDSGFQVLDSRFYV